VRLIFSDEAWEDYLFWQKQDKAVVKRINELIAACKRDLFVGIGKPEPLKYALAGFWSRRITEEHRMVYKAEKDALLIAQLRYPY
jgi:toxin YoeB